MGQRANLFVIQNGEPEIYYTHWRANTLDRDLFWGPVESTAFARRQRSEAEGAELLDEVWAEGGSIIDHTRRILLWYGGEDILYSVPRRRLHLKMMGRFWPDWSVRWASEGIVDMVDYLGISREAVLLKEAPSTEETPLSVFRPLAEASDITTVITSIRDGQCRIFPTDAYIDDILMLGTSLLDGLNTAMGLDSLEWAQQTTEFPQGGLHIDWDRQQISYWFARSIPAIRARVVTLFPEWEVICWDEEFEEHLRVAPNLHFPATDEKGILMKIKATLLHEENDLSALITDHISAYTSPDANVEINPFALRDDILELSADDRRRLLMHYFPEAFSQGEGTTPPP